MLALIHAMHATPNHPVSRSLWDTHADTGLGLRIPLQARDAACYSERITDRDAASGIRITVALPVVTEARYCLMVDTRITGTYADMDDATLAWERMQRAGYGDDVAIVVL